MNVRMYSRPALQEWVDYFVNSALSSGIKDKSAAAAEAERVFNHYSKPEINWRDKDRAEIKFWPRIADLAVEQFKRRSAPGYVAPKRQLKITDCCWLPEHLCQCAALVYSADRTLESPQDFMRASLDMSPEETAAFSLLNACRTVRIATVATHADENFLLSTATDIARGFIENVNGVFADASSKYFAKSGPWIEFAWLRKGDAWCRMASEIYAAYHAWLVSTTAKSHFRAGESPWQFAVRMSSQQQG
jgi:hypothetical protein